MGGGAGVLETLDLGHGYHEHDAHGFGLESHGAMDATFLWNLAKMGRIGSAKLRFDDDFSDRLNYQFTGVLLFLFIGLISIRQYVGKWSFRSNEKCVNKK